MNDFDTEFLSHTFGLNSETPKILMTGQFLQRRSHFTLIEKVESILKGTKYPKGRCSKNKSLSFIKGNDFRSFIHERAQKEKCLRRRFVLFDHTHSSVAGHCCDFSLIAYISK